MDRRAFLRFAGGTALLAGFAPTSVLSQATPTFLNGIVGADGILNWGNGGGDPLQTHLRVDGFRPALSLPRLRLSAGLQATIRDVILNGNNERIDLDQLYRGQVLAGVMVSGNGWLALYPRVMTVQWTNRNFGATSWFVTHTNPGGQIERWQVIVPDICSNLILIPRGGALPCVCDPRLDACRA